MKEPVVWALAAIAIALLTWFSTSMANEAKAKCTAAGGVYMPMRGGHLCLSPGAVVTP